MTHALLFGSTVAALRYAEDAWRSLPPPNGDQVEILTKAFEEVCAGSLPGDFDANEANLRRPHFTACFNGIFGEGTTGYPGEFALAHYGVLLFAEIDSFRPEIAPALAEKLKEPTTGGSPVIFIHAVRAADLPAPLASLNWPRVQL